MPVKSLEKERIMSRKISLATLSVAVMLGAVWGLAEAGLGIGLRSCASLASGSIMTGVGLFFLAATWSSSRRIYLLFLLVVITSLFKMLDALLLSLPLWNGAVANPIFVFIVEGLAFLVLARLISEKTLQARKGQAILGGSAALLASLAFPAVKFVTGIPACVYPGTPLPLSLVFSPAAVALSLFTVPLGFWVGAKARAFMARETHGHRSPSLIYLVSPATLLLCLAIVVWIRLG
jgi:hypothetical protein